MRVAIDARSAQGEFGGVGRGVRSLSQALVAQPELGIEPVLLSSSGLPPVSLTIEEHVITTPWPGNYIAWLQWSIPRWLRSFDGIFHCPFYALPVHQPIPMVVTLHDLTYESHPQWFTAPRRASFRLQARWAAKSARAVMTPSQHVADLVASTYRVAESQIYVVPNAVDPIFRTHRMTPDPEHPYVVAIGGAKRRRLDLAIEAWRLARGQGLLSELVILGPEGPEAWANKEGIRHVGRLDDVRWAALLGGASALLYPTEYEGYGMPAAESATAGTPVVAARNGALPEVLGEAAHWAEDMTPGSFAAALLEAQEGGADSRARALAHGDSLPSWEDSARRLAACYRAAAK